MKYPNGFLIISLAVFGAYFVRCAHAAQNAPTPFSSSGLIQSVNKYSSNPFWNPDSPYNQRMPVPVYATGADLNTGDCNRVVENLIVSYCASHNYCVDSRLNDIRPNIMVQLSQLPGHNFATSCGGYIDSVFEKYQKNRGNVSTGIVHYTTTPTVTSTNTVQYENPFKVTPNEYQSGVAERAAELESLQRVTTASPELTPTYFPKTTADLSFTDRLANTTAGYEPYKDLNPYKTPQFESDAEYYERLKKLNTAEYCKRFPNDDATCKKLAEHDITYVAFGGDVSACPTKYDSRKGLTVACVPTRAKSAFVGWCTDSGLQNCAMTQTIAVNDNDDKTFWAKWGCVGSAKQIGNECVCTDSHMDNYCRCSSPYKIDPSDAKKCVCANGGDVNNNCGVTPPPPTNCPDIHMDANCQCTVVPGTSIDPSTGMCKCDNGKDINNNCQDGTPPTANKPQCIKDIENDATFKSDMTTKLNGVTDLNRWISNNKTDFYQLVANQVVDKCIKISSNLNEFNTFLDISTSISIAIDFNGSQMDVSIDKIELFDYANYQTYPIIIENTGVRNLGSNISKTSVTLPNISSSCGMIYSGSFRGTHPVRAKNSTVGKSAKAIYNAENAEISDALNPFRGQLMKMISGSLMSVATPNYAVAREQIKKFATNINTDTGCAGANLVVYLISELSPDSNKPTTVRIISEPFVIR